jgi:hypothetical protein
MGSDEVRGRGGGESGQHEQWVSSLAPERGGEGSGWGEGPLKKKEAI